MCTIRACGSVSGYCVRVAGSNSTRASVRAASPARPWAKLVRRGWRSALAGLSASSDDSFEHAAHACARFRLARVSVFADAMGCLAILQDKYRLGVITNGSDATHSAPRSPRSV